MQTGTALFVIDMQNDFLLSGRPLCVDGAMQTVPQIKKLLDYARSNDWTVIYVIREHDKNGINADKPRRYLFENGMNGFLTKPIDIKQLLEELDSIIENKTE